MSLPFLLSFPGMTGFHFIIVLLFQFILSKQASSENPRTVTRTSLLLHLEMKSNLQVNEVLGVFYSVYVRLTASVFLPMVKT